MNSLLKPVLVFVLLFTSIGSAQAFTCKELMEVFSKKERDLYVTGIIDMASYASVLMGNEDRAQCITSWFYEPSHHETMTYIEKYLLQYPDKQSAPIITVLINRKCGRLEQST